MESIPEVLEDKDSIREQVDSGSVHDMDYVNPRGVRFTQSTQRDGNGLIWFPVPSAAWGRGGFNMCPCSLPGSSLLPYGLPCLRELFRFLISLTNPHDRHNTDAMMHMGLQLLTVALESGHIVNYPSLLVLVKDELCRHLLQVKPCWFWCWFWSPGRSSCLLSWHVFRSQGFSYTADVGDPQVSVFCSSCCCCSTQQMFLCSGPATEPLHSYSAQI